MTFPSFPEFFKAANGHDPYVWQQRLADHLREHGRWPWHVDVPTGLGKTSCIDIAVYELARQVHDGDRRTAPQRIFHVVDRRTIIDSAVDHSSKLAQQINQATSGPSAAIRTALSRLTPEGSAEVIHVVGIHGERPDDRQWMQRATGCTIASMTSHQFVSRLLLRGHGVSPGNRPVAAALCAIDRLVLFDEPHLSTQAVHTILATERLQGRAVEELGLPRSSTVLLGATVPSYLTALGDDSIWVEIDREREGAKERLRALRPVTADWAAGTDSATSKALVDAARRMVESGANRTVVFANTVGMAQEVHSALVGKLNSSKSPIPVRLVTSRFRPRDKPKKKDLEEPGVIVATQTLEVGVDTSFDALVTELCPWSSLLQRLGRFNRYGEFNADKTFERRPAVVVAGWDAVRDEPSPRKASVSVYGTAQLDACARSLRGLMGANDGGVVNLSPAGLAGVDQSKLEPEQPRVGTLTSAMLPLIAQTRPTPEADIPVDALISGPDTNASAEVEVAWRDNLDVFDVHDVTLRVSPTEVVSIPRNAWAAFLAADKKPTENLHDIEAAPEPQSPAPDVKRLDLYRVWDPADGTWVIPSERQLVRSDRVVMSSTLGGYAPELGWTGSHTEVKGLDISGEAAQEDLDRLFYGGRPVDLILRREDLDTNASGAVEKLVEAFNDAHEELSRGVPWKDIDDAAVIKASEAYVESLISTPTTDDVVPERAQAPTPQPKATVVGLIPDTVIVRVKVTLTHSSDRVPLDEHQAQVGAWASADATAAGLNSELIGEVAYAGAHHDDGKSYEVFQDYLGGDQTTLLAKSGRPAELPWVDRRRRAEVGLPNGWRHEMESVRRIPQASALVRHLVGSHHGWFRPVAPPTPYAAGHDGYPLPVAHGDDFDQLNARFGVWGLAYLESLVRMADWRASAHPQKCSDVQALPEVAPRVSPTDPSPVSRTAHSFPGLHTHPMTGWFAAVGLLAAAARTDPGARLRWEPLSSDATETPLVPVLTTSEQPEQLVRRIIESASWRSARELTDGVLAGGGLKIKGQKVGPASALHGLLESAEEQQEWLLSGLLNDLAPAEASSKIPLAIAPFANNATYLGIAFERVDRGKMSARSADEALEALTTTSAGFSHTKCDGGMDRNLAETPGVNGLGDPVTRLSRSALAPLALYGMASLGAGPVRGIGVVTAGDVALPLPIAEHTFPQLRALTYLGSGRRRWPWASAGLEWIYAAEKQPLTAYEAVWNGRATLRS